MTGFGTSTARRTAAFGILAVALALGGCGDERESAVAGYYVNTRDSKDVIEIMSGGEAKMTALAGKHLTVWNYRGPARSGLGRSLQGANAALARYETVEVTYEFMEVGNMIVFKAPGRGQRLMKYNAEAGVIDDSGRQYLRMKKR